MFKVQNFPYILTLLIGVSGWTVKEISSRLHSLNALEYTVSYSEGKYEATLDNELMDLNGKKMKKAIFHVTNLSLNKSHTNIKFIVAFPHTVELDTLSDIVVQGKLFPNTPLSIPGNSDKRANSSLVTYDIKVIPPDTRFQFTVYYQGHWKPSINHRLLHEGGGGDFKFMRANTLTFILKNDIQILIILFSVWSLLIVVYLVVVQKDQKKGAS